jgi:hypothetical protein
MEPGPIPAQDNSDSRVPDDRSAPPNRSCVPPPSGEVVGPAAFLAMALRCTVKRTMKLFGMGPIAVVVGGLFAGAAAISWAAS